MGLIQNGVILSIVCLSIQFSSVFANELHPLTIQEFQQKNKVAVFVQDDLSQYEINNSEIRVAEMNAVNVENTEVAIAVKPILLSSLR